MMAILISRLILSLLLLTSEHVFSSGHSLSAPCGVGNMNANFGTNATIPQQLCVPALAYDQSSITLVWNKPGNYGQIVDYNIYMSGKKVGNASGNAAIHNPAKAYFDGFYAEDSANFHTKIGYHSYKATGLKANTLYKFTIRSVDSMGKESADSIMAVAKTAPKYAKIVDVAALGAKGDGKTLNTKIIQKAIDECANGSQSAFGCKVLIGGGAATANGAAFLTGALFLRSNMTLEIVEGTTLLGSTNSDDYPLSRGYQMYSFFNNPTDDRRPPSLLNALNEKHMNGPIALADHQGYDESRGIFTNIRIVGKGRLDGNGWARRAADLVDEVGNKLAMFDAGTRETWGTLGMLAKNQMEAAKAEAGGTLSTTQNANYYSNRRSSLTTFRGVRNIYFGELTLTNPAFHGVMFIECENMVFANTVTQTFDINNADGVEFGNSKNALVFNNFMNTGDDCINFAAGQGREYEEGKAAAQEFAWIFNNYLREGHGAVVTGSHTGAWIQDILAEDNVAFLTDNGLRIKSTPATGGGVRRVIFRDNAMREIGTQNKKIGAGGKEYDNGGGKGNPLILTLAYSAGSNEFKAATASAKFSQIIVRGVTIDNGNASTAGGAMISVDGYDGADPALGYAETFHTNLVFTDVKITNAKPAIISRLKESAFANVTITNWGKANSPWSISNSTQLKFINVSPAPAEF